MDKYVEARIGRPISGIEHDIAHGIFRRRGSCYLPVLDPYIQFLRDNDINNYAKSRAGRELDKTEQDTLSEILARGGNVTAVDLFTSQLTNSSDKHHIDPIEYVERRLERKLLEGERNIARFIFEWRGGNSPSVLDPFIQFLYDGNCCLKTYCENRAGRKLTEMEEEELHKIKDLISIDIFASQLPNTNLSKFYATTSTF
jgi:hypothetical protein